MGIFKMISNPFGNNGNDTIGFDDLEKAIASKSVHVVDVREVNEYASGHVPSASNQPLSAFDPTKLPSDRPVVLICQAGGRSAKALAAARASGRTDVVHFAGGTGGWRAQGGAVE